jgi:GMP synthase (glutamine-hydrolysing)
MWVYATNNVLFIMNHIINKRLLSKKILSILNIDIETLGTLGPLFRSDGFQIEEIKAQEYTIPINPDKYSAIVILGGPMAVYDNLGYLTREQELIRNAIRKEVPVLGICLGSQLIAQAIGGRVYKGPKKEIGWFNVSITDHGLESLFEGIKHRTLRVFQWHGDTYDLPARAYIMASSTLYPQAFRYGTAVGIQFHLEVDGEMIQRWLQEYSEEIFKECINPQDIKLYNERSNIADLNDACKVVYSNFSKLIDTKTKY